MPIDDTTLLLLARWIDAHLREDEREQAIQGMLALYASDDAEYWLEQDFRRVFDEAVRRRQ